MFTILQHSVLRSKPLTIKFHCSSQDQTHIVETVAKNLGISKRILLGKMTAIKMLVMDDDKMLKEIDKLNKKVRRKLKLVV